MLFAPTSYVGEIDRSQRGATTERYAPLPRASRATLLVPTRSARVTSATLRDYASSNTARATLLAQVGSALGRVGAFKMWRSRLVVIESANSESLMGYTKSLFGPNMSAAIQLGPPRPNRKPIVALRSSDGTAKAYMKVGINPLTKARVANEGLALSLLGTAEGLALEVPRLLHRGEWGEMNYLITEAVDTRSAGSESVDVTSRAMTSLAAAFAGGSPNLSRSHWWLMLSEELASLSGQEARCLQSLARRILDRYSAHPVPIGAAHGDWAPWNIAVKGSRAMVWDWERFRTDVPVGWDAIHFEIESNRRAGSSAQSSITQLIPKVGRVVARNGATPGDGNLLLATFLLDLGTRQLLTRSAAQPDSRGDIQGWLTPALAALLNGSADADLT